MKRNKDWVVPGSWSPRRLEVLMSPAWRNAPRALKEILEALEIENLRHRGSANGQLFKSYQQFVECGINRTTVSLMIRIGEALGLLKVNRETGIGKPDLRDASAYRLTYLPSGIVRDVAPTDDWKRIRSDEQAIQIIERERVRPKTKRKLKEAA